ncbi:MAG: phenylalanine--tRNA ligase subunit alpha [Patescibacteria group bacterium]
MYIDREQCKHIQNEAAAELAHVTTREVLEQLRLKYFGRKDGVLTTILRSLKDLSEEDKKTVGRAAHEAKLYLEDALAKKEHALIEAELHDQQHKEKIDVTAPGIKVPAGHLHPLTQLISKACDIFTAMGFAVAEGPEVETERYNFDALNVPKDHPARDMQDTFWLDPAAAGPGMLLRTQTSSVQIRYMETHKPPFRIVAPGRVFRNEATDATHEAQFYQFEGFMVGKDVSLANAKAVLEVFFQRLLANKKIAIRFRPSYFPFTEPSVEGDVTCFKCFGKKCAVCKRTGWLEVVGAGMVHPKVLENVGIDAREWQGFAFGVGLDRIAMVRYGIDDIRLMYSGDMRFLKQF